MYESMLVISILIIVYLAVRVFMKFREIASWKPESQMGSEGDRGVLPQELIELKIEAPSSDSLDSLSSLDGRDPSKGAAPP